MKYSLKGFLCDYGIEIPLIQREYAQGRKEAKVTAVRESFLQDIVDCLLPDATRNIELDFVFGQVKGNTVYPIDGQQRLTTMMLVYWYFGCLLETSRFAYSGRRMASCFVQELIGSVKTYNYENCGFPDKWIKCQKWFQSVWLCDATVFGMLRTLRTLHTIVEKYNSVKLQRNKLDEICFHFDPLNDVDADEGYRKMNARGKTLSDWENIKVVVEDCVWSKDFKSIKVSDVNIRDIWMHAVSGQWLVDMENLLPAKADADTVDDYIKKSVERVNTGFRNVLDLAIFLNAVRNVESSKENFLKKIDRKVISDQTRLDVVFGERAADLKLCTLEEEKKLENAIAGEPTWKVLKPIVLKFYEQMFRQHRAYPVEYSKWVNGDVLKLAIDVYNALRSRYIEDEWTGKRQTNLFWRDFLHFQEQREDKPREFDKCKIFAEDFLFAQHPSRQNAAKDFTISTAIRVYIISKVATLKGLTEDVVAAVRHLYNLLDNQGDVSAEALPSVLDFVDELVTGDANCQKSCLEKSLSNRDIFNGCRYQKEEECWKSKLCGEAKKRCLDYEVEYSALNGNIGFLFKKELPNEDFKREFDRVVWRRGELPQSAIFEVLKVANKENFDFHSSSRRLEIPPEGAEPKDNLYCWKRILNSSVWRNVFDTYVTCGGVCGHELPEITFLLANLEKGILNDRHFLRLYEDGRFYLSKTERYLRTYTWLMYGKLAEKILTLVNVPFATSDNVSRLPLDALASGCRGWYLDAQALFNGDKGEVSVYKSDDPNCKGKKLTLSDKDDEWYTQICGICTESHTHTIAQNLIPEEGPNKAGL